MKLLILATQNSTWCGPNIKHGILIAAKNFKPVLKRPNQTGYCLKPILATYVCSLDCLQHMGPITNETSKFRVLSYA